MQNYKKLQIWQLSHKLVLEAYSLTNGLPDQEKYGLTSQLRRAVVSIPTNIAEGCSRVSDRDFKNFIHIALGSLAEVSYLLALSQELGFIEESIYQGVDSEIEQLRPMLINFLKRLRTT